MVTLVNPVAELNVQECPGGSWIIDGHGQWRIVTARSFREMLIETQRRGQLFFNDRKVIRFDGDLFPVVEGESQPCVALAVPGSGWSFFGGR
jgi:hypothetical protein